MMKKSGKVKDFNIGLTILLFIGCITILFPLYMAIVIALKDPSEMTNDVAGALSFPAHLKFSNFSEAMKVTNFWHSLGNSLIICVTTIVLAIVIPMFNMYSTIQAG